MEIARLTRGLELTGLSISLASLALSLFIFFYFRSLQNHRTRIHKNLFAAIGIQVIVRLTLYMDQAIAGNGASSGTAAAAAASSVITDDQQQLIAPSNDNANTTAAIINSIGIHTTVSALTLLFSFF